MKTAVQNRRDRGVFNSAFGALCVLGISSAIQNAAAADDASPVSVNMAALITAPAPAPVAAATPAPSEPRPGVLIKNGVVTMLPVGESVPEGAPAPRRAVDESVPEKGRT